MLVEFQYPVFDPPLGGVENYIVEASAAFRELGHDTQVFCGPARKPSMDILGLPVFRYPDVTPSGLALLLRPYVELRRIRAHQSLERPTPDLVIARFPSHAITAREVLPPSTKVVYLPAVDLAKRQAVEALSGHLLRRLLGRWFVHLWHRIERRAILSADRFVVLSKNMARQMASHAPRQADVIPPGVNTERFAPNPERRAEVRSRLGISDDAVVVLTVSRLSPEKSIDLALKALASVEGPWHYIVAGSGDLDSDLMKLARTLGIQERVSFVGVVEHPEHLYASADICLHPAREEPFGHVLLEGMASTLPLVAASSRGSSVPVASDEVIAPDRGFLFTHGDVPELQEILHWLIDSGERRKTLGETGRRFVQGVFSWRRHGQALALSADPSVGLGQ